MKTNTNISRWARVFGAMLTVALMVSAVAFSQVNIPLGGAATFGVLAGSAITNTGVTAINGDIGSYPTAAISGFGSGTGTFTGTNHGNDGVAQAAQADLTTAYDLAAAQAATATPVGGILTGTLTPGVYVLSAATPNLTGTVTLSGTASDYWIFKASSTLITATGSQVILSGAVWNHVFWQVGSTATLGSSSTFEGTILALTSINVANGATVHGRLLARNAAVSLDNNTALPVEIVSFTAAADRMNANLHWSTATEVNNYGFEIERRQTADWAKVGFVTGAGTSNAPRDYSYTDNNLSSGRYTYRLKQVDNNGAFSYHGSVEVQIGLAPQKFALLQNYPNPFNPSTTIQYSLEKPSQVSLKVYNVLGLEVATLVNSRQEAGSYTVPFSAIGGSTLASGVYIYRLEAGSFVSTKKLVLMK